MNILDGLHETIDSTGWGRPTMEILSRAARPRIPTIADRVYPRRSPGEKPSSFSVIIPCYNYARFLRQAVSSAVEQEGVEVQVIVIDDASTDDSFDVASELAVRDPRVSVIRNPQNQGHVRTFNTGYSAATGEFIVRLDADDLLAPGSLARAAALFRTFPTVGLVYGHPRHFTTSQPPEPQGERETWTVWSGQNWLAERCRRGYNCITTPEAVVRAAVMREFGPLDTALRFAQDMELWLRIAAASDVGRINGVDQALHRDHPVSMSVTDGAGIVTDLHERRTVFTQVFRRMGEHIAKASVLEEIWRRALAAESLNEACRSYDRGRYDGELIRELDSFAHDTYPETNRLREWRSLNRRRRLGPVLTRWMPTSIVRVLARRLEGEFAYLRWTRFGV